MNNGAQGRPALLYFAKREYIYLVLCPQWTYLSVLIGYIADGSGNEYLI